MGYAACTGTLDVHALLLGGLLFAWQFPHFNSLSYNIRGEYARAGYLMMSTLNPGKNAAVALRYSALMFPICLGIHATGLTTVWFLAGSTVLNTYMLLAALRFFRGQDAKSARALFFASLVHLPVMLVLMILYKADAGVTEELGDGEETSKD